MYFFYIDESGSRDAKADEPYILTAVGMYENQWRGFNKHLMGMKTNIARKYDPDIRQDQLEVKANLFTKPKSRKDSPFFKHLTADEIDHISKHYLAQLGRWRLVVITTVIDKAELPGGMDADAMHRKAYELLLERIQNHMRDNHREHNALIIMDDAGAPINRRIALMHARLLGAGNHNVDFENIIEYPIFTASELSNGVQLADVVAYTFYHSFKYNKPDYEYLKRILPRVARLKRNPRTLAGLKIWPESERYNSVFNTIQDKLPKPRKAKKR